MGGVPCPECKGYWMFEDHDCPVKLKKEIHSLRNELMRQSGSPLFEQGEIAGQDQLIYQLATLTEYSNSRLAEAVRMSPIYQTRLKILRDLAETLELAGYKLGEEPDAEASMAFRQQLCILQKRAAIYGGLEL